MAALKGGGLPGSLWGGPAAGGHRCHHCDHPAVDGEPPGRRFLCLFLWLGPCLVRELSYEELSKSNYKKENRKEEMCYEELSKGKYKKKNQKEERVARDGLYSSLLLPTLQSFSHRWTDTRASLLLFSLFFSAPAGLSRSFERSALPRGPWGAPAPCHDYNHAVFQLGDLLAEIPEKKAL